MYSRTERVSELARGTFRPDAACPFGNFFFDLALAAGVESSAREDGDVLASASENYNSKKLSPADDESDAFK